MLTRSTISAVLNVYCVDNFPEDVDIHQLHTRLTYPQSNSKTGGKRMCRQNGCGKVFVSTSSLNRHMRSVHSSELEVVCSNCFVTFSRKDVLDKHTAEGRCGEQLIDVFNCEPCGYQCQRQHDMEKHRSTETHRLAADDVTHNLTCSACDDEFSNEYQLRQHKNTCNKSNKFASSGFVHCVNSCGRRFETCKARNMHCSKPSNCLQTEGSNTSTRKYRSTQSKIRNMAVIGRGVNIAKSQYLMDKGIDECGLHATRVFRPNDVITYYDGRVRHVDRSAACVEGNNPAQSSSHFKRLRYAGADVVIDGLRGTTTNTIGRGGGSLCNHHDQPNAKLDDDKSRARMWMPGFAEGPLPMVLVVATRRIVVGEEVFVNYQHSSVERLGIE